MARTISLSLPEDLYEWLELQSKRRNKTIQQVIRESIEEIRALRHYKIVKILDMLEVLEEDLEEIIGYLEELVTQFKYDKR